MTEEEKAMIEAIAQRVIVWAINNQHSDVEFMLQTDEYAKAITKRVNEIASGAPMRVSTDLSKWFGVYGTIG